MVIDDKLVKGNESLRQGAGDFFFPLYQEEYNWTVKSDGINFCFLDNESRVSLEKKNH